MKREDNLNRILVTLASSETDEEAWKELYLALWPFVVGVLFRKLGANGRQVVEDASQEVFMRLVRTKPFARIQDGDQFRAYTWKMAENVANDWIQKNQFARSRTEPLDESTLKIAHEASSWSDTLDLIRKSLGDSDQALLELLLAGRNLEEIASDQGINYSTAGVRLHRLRLKVSNILQSQDKK